MRFYDILKNIFLVLILLQIAPPLIIGIKNQYRDLLEPKTKVGVIHLKGVLSEAAPYVGHAQKLFKDTEIKAILLKVECPGGASGTGETIFNEIQALKAEYPKPVVVLVENVCASAAYWISCSADHIVAPSTSLVGSIGAYFPYLFQLRNFIEGYNIQYKAIKAGTYKTAGDPFVNMSPEEQAYLQKVIDDTYVQFSKSVAQCRKLSLAKVSEWADGKIFTGAQAKELNLIDEIGSAHQATAAIKARASIEGEIEWVHARKDQGFLAKLFTGNDDNSESSMSSQMMNGICSYLETRYAATSVH
jgi:protease-4